MRKKRIITPNAADVDSVNNFFPQSITNRLVANNMDVKKALRTNGLLRKQEWEELDLALVDVARQRLQLVSDLRSMGLTLRLGGLGTLVSQYEQLGDMSAANVDMSGVTPGQEDAPDFTLVSIPVPITHKDFRVNIRKLEASRRLGDAIDVTQVQTAGRRVADALESMVLSGISGKLDGNALYGYTNHPSRNTGTAVGSFGTIANIFTTISNMVSAAEADNYFGPYILYVATAQYGQMRAVYTDGSGQSAIVRVLQNIPSIKQIKPVDQMTAGEVLLVQMTKDVVDLAIAQDIVTVQWDEMGGMVEKFKVMGCMVPRIKSDSGGRSGIVHYTGAS